MDVIVARTFLAAAATGSFLAAARRVNASAPTVTERIKQLEHVLGSRLFERDKRGCRLTAAGRRLIEPAQAFVRAWEDGCARVALPSHFERVVRIGGQHALWPPLLISWLARVRAEWPTTAFHASAAAPAQLNRAIADDELDIAFLYDPVISRGIRIEEIAPDRLVLATANPDLPWEDNFVRFYWGESANAEISARLDKMPAFGLDLDLGVISLDWLVQTGSSGYIPERLAHLHFAAGTLTPVECAPTVAFSPYVCWRSGLDPAFAERIVALAQQGMTEPT